MQEDGVTGDGHKSRHLLPAEPEGTGRRSSEETRAGGEGRGEGGEEENGGACGGIRLGLPRAMWKDVGKEGETWDSGQEGQR